MSGPKGAAGAKTRLSAALRKAARNVTAWQFMAVPTFASPLGAVNVVGRPGAWRVAAIRWQTPVTNGQPWKETTTGQREIAEHHHEKDLPNEVFSDAATALDTAEMVAAVAFGAVPRLTLFAGMAREITTPDRHWLVVVFQEPGENRWDGIALGSFEADGKIEHSHLFLPPIIGNWRDAIRAADEWQPPEQTPACSCTEETPPSARMLPPIGMLPSIGAWTRELPGAVPGEPWMAVATNATPPLTFWHCIEGAATGTLTYTMRHCPPFQVGKPPLGPRLEPERLSAFVKAIVGQERFRDAAIAEDQKRLL